jgi:protein transport protein SEC24
LHIHQQSQPSSASHLFPVQAPPPTANNPIISFPPTNVNNTFANSNNNNNNQIGSLAPTASPLGHTSLGPSQINHQQPQQFQSFQHQAPSAQPLSNSSIPNSISHIGTLPPSQPLQPSMPQPPPLMNFNRGGPPISLVGPILSQTGPSIPNNMSSINGPPLGGVSNSVQQNFNRPTAPPTNQGPPITNGPPLQQQQQNFQPNQPPVSSRPPGPPLTTNTNLLQNNNGPQHFQPTIPTPSQPTFNRPGPPQTNQPPINQFNTMSISQQPQFQQQQQQQPPQTSSKSNRNQPNAIDLLREKRLIQPYSDESDQPARPIFPHEFYTQVNCHTDTIRCTLTAIPETQSLLSKLRLPLGILIHPFKDLESLKVVQSATIVRCRSCRSYINPFVHFLDNSKWRCNMCYSINDLPDEFLFDPVTRSYGDPSKRPEINSSTIEFIAPPEYTVSLGRILILNKSY